MQGVSPFLVDFFFPVKHRMTEIVIYEKDNLKSHYFLSQWRSNVERLWKKSDLWFSHSLATIIKYDENNKTNTHG